ncbi:hypothetical protein DFP72DRAFT_917889 [Ephemerocybe angulata]|uniref:Uncharacterized protein n=1 Tax=Ephemerocybe angulata TaxID=980116 RepID=A0A8H6HKC2_9AGAR|nr:hypothetical protein DFP72DRAFT_917889 [Tulosesus angulatus]
MQRRNSRRRRRPRSRQSHTQRRPRPPMPRRRNHTHRHYQRRRGRRGRRWGRRLNRIRLQPRPLLLIPIIRNKPPLLLLPRSQQPALPHFLPLETALGLRVVRVLDEARGERLARVWVLQARYACDFAVLEEVRAQLCDGDEGVDVHAEHDGGRGWACRVFVVLVAEFVQLTPRSPTTRLPRTHRNLPRIPNLRNLLLERLTPKLLPLKPEHPHILVLAFRLHPPSFDLLVPMLHNVPRKILVVIGSVPPRQHIPLLVQITVINELERPLLRPLRPRPLLRPGQGRRHSAMHRLSLRRRQCSNNRFQRLPLMLTQSIVTPRSRRILPVPLPRPIPRRPLPIPIPIPIPREPSTTPTAPRIIRIPTRRPRGPSSLAGDRAVPRATSRAPRIRRAVTVAVASVPSTLALTPVIVPVPHIEAGRPW